MRRDPPPTRRRTSRPRRPHRQPWPPTGPARRPPSPVGTGLLVLAALGLGGLATTGLYAPVLLLLFAFTGLVVATVVILPMELIKAGSRLVERRAAADPAPGPAWAGARERYDRLRGEYAAYECDPLAVLRLPALADVAVPSTARFVDALAEAQALCTEEHPGEPMAARFVDAAEHAEQAWQAARDAAGRIRLAALDPAERRRAERVVKLLGTARDTDSEPERLIAYARARSELARLERSGAIHVPPPARAALDAASRGALPG